MKDSARRRSIQNKLAKLRVPCLAKSRVESSVKHQGRWRLPLGHGKGACIAVDFPLSQPAVQFVVQFVPWCQVHKGLSRKQKFPSARGRCVVAHWLRQCHRNSAWFFERSKNSSAVLYRPRLPSVNSNSSLNPSSFTLTALNGTRYPLDY